MMGKNKRWGDSNDDNNDDEDHGIDCFACNVYLILQVHFVKA